MQVCNNPKHKTKDMKEFKFKIGAKDYSASVEEQENGLLQVTVNGKAYEVELPEHASAAHKPIVRPTTAAAPAAAAPAAAKPAANSANIIAPLPGTITKVVAKAGTQVKKGDVLVVMEAMKMANDIVAEADGTVKAVCVNEGQSVNQGDALIEFEAAGAPAAPAAAPAPKAPEAPKAAPAAAPAPKAAPAAGASVVAAPLPGTITKIVVTEGQAVKAGDSVLVMEAMKMANDITAETDGTVTKILVQPGAQVQSGDALVELG